MKNTIRLTKNRKLLVSIKVLLAFSLFFALSFNMQAQTGIAKFIDEGKHNASLLADSYIDPFGHMLSKSLSGGWYNTAKVHKPWGFDFTINVNVASVAPELKTFDMLELLDKFEGSGYSLKDESNNIAPNFASKEMDENSLPVLRKNGKELFTMPNGAGVSSVPLPMAQLTLGIPFHTDVSLRLLPKIPILSLGSISSYGFGVKHSFKEYIPIVSELPFLNTSVMLGYTSLAADLSFEESGDKYDFNIGSTALISRLLIGIDVPILSVYTGLGYGGYSTDYDFSLKSDEFAAGIFKRNTVDFNAGLRLKLGFLTLHGDYTFGDYSLFTAGIGISIR